MFRFSIRELLLVTVLVATAVAWVAEHRRLNAALLQANKAGEEASIWESRCGYYEKGVENMEKGIEQWGFEVLWWYDTGPSVCKRLPDGTLTSIPDSN